jgi:hypothetical protein
MKTITIRDLRQRWPEAEAALQVEDEILITRDSQAGRQARAYRSGKGPAEALESGRARKVA